MLAELRDDLNGRSGKSIQKYGRHQSIMSLLGAPARLESTLLTGRDELSQPVPKSRRADQTIRPGQKRLFVQHCAEVPRLPARHHAPGIFVAAQNETGELMEKDPFRAGHLNRTISCWSRGDRSDRLGEIV